MAGQSPVALVNIGTGGSWMCIHPKMVALVLTHSQMCKGTGGLRSRIELCKMSTGRTPRCFKCKAPLPSPNITSTPSPQMTPGNCAHVGKKASYLAWWFSSIGHPLQISFPPIDAFPFNLNLLGHPKPPEPTWGTPQFHHQATGSVQAALSEGLGSARPISPLQIVLLVAWGSGARIPWVVPFSHEEWKMNGIPPEQKSKLLLTWISFRALRGLGP